MIIRKLLSRQSRISTWPGQFWRSRGSKKIFSNTRTVHFGMLWNKQILYRKPALLLQEDQKIGVFCLLRTETLVFLNYTLLKDKLTLTGQKMVQ